MFLHQTVITDVTTTDATLGLDFLEQQECAINTAKKTLQFREQRPVVTLTNSSTSKSVVVQVELTLDKSQKLPAYSEMKVMIKAPGSVAGKTWILETSNSRRNAVAVARAIVHQNEG